MDDHPIPLQLVVHEIFLGSERDSPGVSGMKSGVCVWITCAQHRHTRVRIISLIFLCAQILSPRRFQKVLGKKVEKRKKKKTGFKTKS